MAMEVSCGQCRGRLLVETPGVIVACPHCGVHLSIPLPEQKDPLPAISMPSHEILKSASPNDVATSGPQSSASDHSPPESRPQLSLPPESSRAETIILSGSPDAVPKSSPVPAPEPVLPQKGVRPLATEDKSDTKHNWEGDRPRFEAKPPEPPSSIFHAPQDKIADQPQEDEIGWPSSPKLSLKDPTPPEIESTNTQIESNKSPDFSWMEAPKDATTQELPSPFSFGTPPAETDEVPKLSVAESAQVTGPPDTETVADSQKPEPDSQHEHDPVIAPNENFTPPVAIDQGIAQPLSVEDNPWIVPINNPSKVQGQRESETESQPFDHLLTGGFGNLASGPVNEIASLPVAQEEISPRSLEGISPATDSRAASLATLLIVVASYASLTTIYLVYSLFFSRAHQLESLPDLKTVQEQGGRAAVPRPANDLPPGHELRFGQSQRYGDIRVTPLRVTRGQITFTHQSGDKTQERTPSEPVLKLWLKFENVSPNQEITPIDTTLIAFRRVLDDRVASYNAIFRDQDRKKKNERVYYLFDRIAADTEWMMVGQHTNETLAPHQTYETFVPSEENIEGLNGELVWRVHFRKGHGPKTGNGVTTLIDVHFNSDEIKSET